MLIFNNYPNIFSIFSLLYKDDTGNSAMEINVWCSRQSSWDLKFACKTVGFVVILHDKLLNREHGQGVNTWPERV